MQGENENKRNVVHTRARATTIIDLRNDFYRNFLGIVMAFFSLNGTLSIVRVTACNARMLPPLRCPHRRRRLHRHDC